MGKDTQGVDVCHPGRQEAEEKGDFVVLLKHIQYAGITDANRRAFTETGQYLLRYLP